MDWKLIFFKKFYYELNFIFLIPHLTFISFICRPSCTVQLMWQNKTSCLQSRITYPFTFAWLFNFDFNGLFVWDSSEEESVLEKGCVSLYIGILNWLLVKLVFMQFTFWIYFMVAIILFLCTANFDNKLFKKLVMVSIFWDF